MADPRAACTVSKDARLPKVRIASIQLLVRDTNLYDLQYTCMNGILYEQTIYIFA